MKICFERSGGLVGGKICKEIDADSLSAGQTCQLDKLLDQSGFFGLPLKLQAAAGGADRFNYTLTIRSESRAHTVEIEEAAIPARVRPLLEWLMKI